MLEERDWYVVFQKKKKEPQRSALARSNRVRDTAPGGREDLNLKPTKASFQSLHAAALFKTSLLAFYHLNPG